MFRQRRRRRKPQRRVRACWNRATQPGYAPHQQGSRLDFTRSVDSQLPREQSGRPLSATDMKLAEAAAYCWPDGRPRQDASSLQLIPTLDTYERPSILSCLASIFARWARPSIHCTNACPWPREFPAVSSEPRCGPYASLPEWYEACQLATPG